MATRKVKRDLAKELLWRQHVQGHATSGLSVRDFCQQQQLSEASFFAWRKTLTLRDAEQESARSPSPASLANRRHSPQRAQAAPKRPPRQTKTTPKVTLPFAERLRYSNVTEAVKAGLTCCF